MLLEIRVGIKYGTSFVFFLLTFINVWLSFQLFLAKLVWRISIYKILTKTLWTPNFWHFKIFNIYKLISPQTIARSILLQRKKEMMKMHYKKLHDLSIKKLPINNICGLKLWFLFYFNLLYIKNIPMLSICSFYLWN